MHYIVFDLEFNQDLTSMMPNSDNTIKCPFEIIQIGAVKLDSEYNTAVTFNRYVKPNIYSSINQIVTALTGITIDQLISEQSFPEVLADFVKFIGEDESVFCTWGMSDMKELFRNMEYYKLDKKLIPALYINLQPYISHYLNSPASRPLKLQVAVEALEIPTIYQFHNALHDAYYTAELLKVIHITGLEPKRYDPDFKTPRPHQPKKIIDIERLLEQFEKMYARELNEEEKNMILLAYKMGKTHQFIIFLDEQK